MATRNLVMFVDRAHARGKSDGLAVSPDEVSDKSYVNMYQHHDGYPEWQGVQIANWLHSNVRQDGSAMAAKFVHDFYYDSVYLYADNNHIDHQYTYIIWTGDKNRTVVACHDRYNSYCVFVLPAEKIISKYMNQNEPMDYTDFANGETRYMENNKSKKVQLSLDNAKKIVDILNGSLQD